MLESLTRTMTPEIRFNSSSTDTEKSSNIAGKEDLALTHLLRMQADKSEIVRARTAWIPKTKVIMN